MEIKKTNEGVAFACGSSWGIGAYTFFLEDGVTEEACYGYPPKGMNPHKFRPDMESCFPREIEAWEKAKLEWDVRKMGMSLKYGTFKK